MPTTPAGSNPATPDLRRKYKDIKKRLASLEREKANGFPNPNNRKKDDENGYFPSTGESSASESDYDSKTPKTLQLGKKKIKRRNPSIQKIFHDYQRCLQKMATKVIKGEEGDEELSALVNSLSSTQISKAMKVNNGYDTENPNNPTYPILRKEGEAELKDLKEAITTLKDVFKTGFKGEPSEDLVSFLQMVGKLAVASNLDIDQFYTLLKSRLIMSTQLYEDVKHHHRKLSTPKTLFKEIIPLYTNLSTYLDSVNNLNSITISGKTPQAVLARVKQLTNEVASHMQGSDTDTFVYNTVRNKLLCLYPLLAPSIIEREREKKGRNIGEFTRIFLHLAPSLEYSKKNKYAHNSVNSTNQLQDDYTFEVLEIKPTGTVHRIKLSKEHLSRLSGKCFKCANETEQEPHMGRDCLLYKDTPLAFYLCNQCEVGVHLPKHCRSGPNANSINRIEFELLEEEMSHPSKNV